MTIQTETAFDGPLPGDGSTTDFSFTFPVNNSLDVEVELIDTDGSVYILAEDVDCLITINDDQDNNPGGTITYPASGTNYLASTQSLVVSRGTPFTQPMDLKNAGSFREQVIEDSFDRMTMQLQRMRNSIRRFIMMPWDAIDGDITASAADRANGYLGWDSSGNPTVKMTQIIPNSVTLTTFLDGFFNTSINNISDFLTALGFSSFGKSIVASASAAAAQSTIGIPDLLQKNIYTYFTTGGTAPNFTLTPSPAIIAYSSGQMFSVNFNADGTTGSNTLNVSGQGALALKQYDASGNKRSGVVASGMRAIVMFDGVDMIIMTQLPQGSSSGVRQTVQTGPVMTGDRYPYFLPATATGLNLTTQYISPAAPFLVSAANGTSDMVGVATSNITWNALANNATNYLYVDVGSDGSLTPGYTTAAPVYSFSAFAASTTSGVHTFSYDRMIMLVGNGSAAVGGYYRVFVGEAVTSGGNITSTSPYAYNGRFVSADYGMALSTNYSIWHNIGAPVAHRTVLVCQTAELGLSVGDEADPSNIFSSSAGQHYGIGTYIPSASKNKIVATVGTSGVAVMNQSTVGNVTAITISKWKLRTYVNRVF